jgi:hypothetical protein
MPRNRASERHTFGSDPHVRGAAAHDEPTTPVLGVVHEPERPTWWVAARELAGDLPEPSVTEVVGGLFEHVEQGWKLVESLQLLSNYDPTHTSSAIAQLLSFVQSDVLSPFLSLARAAANTARALSSGGASPDPDALIREADRFARNAFVAFLASADPLVPDNLRTTVRPACEALYDWAPDFAAYAGAAARIGRGAE